MTRMRSANIDVPILGPLAVAIVVLLGTAVGGICLLKTREINSQVRDQIGELDVLFRRHVEEDARWLDGYIRLLTSDEQLQHAWLMRARPALLHRAQTLFEDLRVEQQITHFYFHDLDQMCFLRVHNPDRFGDHIDRITMREAAGTRDLSSGVELGPMGTLTLRVVRPWIIDGKLAGYIELGQEVDGLITLATTIMDVDLIVTIDKSFLDRDGWEEGMQMMGREPDWDLSPDVVAHDQTLEHVSADLLAQTSQMRGRKERRLFRWTGDGVTYRGGVLPLLDAAGTRVGDFIVMKDVRELEAGALTLSSVLVVLAVLVAVMLIISFHHYLRRIRRRLRTAYTSLNTEIGVRRQKERELREHRENLEYLVNTRTVELRTANRQLTEEVKKRVKAQRQLGSLNEELERTVQNLSVSNRDLQELLRVAAHDLKTPIVTIEGFIGAFREDFGKHITEDGDKYLKYISDATRKMETLINDLLELSRVGRLPETTAEFSFGHLVEEILTNLRPLIHEKGIEIHVQENLPVMRAERKRMVQVMENLLSNAVKYIDTDNPSPKIEVGMQEQNGRHVFYVQDNGIGIDPKYFEKIFQVFQRLPQAKKMDDGTGIGLTTAQRIIEHHGGKIWIDSQPGKGTTFFFTIQDREA